MLKVRNVTHTIKKIKQDPVKGLKLRTPKLPPPVSQPLSLSEKKAAQPSRLLELGAAAKFGTGSNAGRLVLS